MNVGRAVDRALMAAEIVRVALNHRWDVETEELAGRREFWVTLKGPRGLSITVDLDGASRQQRQGTHVLSWCVRGTEARLSCKFGDVNPFHRQKATDVCEGFKSVLTTLEKRMAQANTGEAFE